MNDSRQSAYSTRSFISVPQNNDSKLFTNGIKDLVRDHWILLEIVQEDKELFEKYKRKRKTTTNHATKEASQGI